VEEWVAVALAQLDAENRYRLRAAHGQPETGLALLDKLDRALRHGNRQIESKDEPGDARAFELARHKMLKLGSSPSSRHSSDPHM
jgi:hypothetical protein